MGLDRALFAVVSLLGVLTLAANGQDFNIPRNFHQGSDTNMPQISYPNPFLPQNTNLNRPHYNNPFALPNIPNRNPFSGFPQRTELNPFVPHNPFAIGPQSGPHPNPWRPPFIAPQQSSPIPSAFEQPFVPQGIGSRPFAPKQTRSIPLSPEQTGSIPFSPQQTGSIPGAPQQIGSIPFTPQQSGSIPGIPQQIGSISFSPQKQLESTPFTAESIPVAPPQTFSVPAVPPQISSIPVPLPELGTIPDSSPQASSVPQQTDSKPDMPQPSIPSPTGPQNAGSNSPTHHQSRNHAIANRHRSRGRPSMSHKPPSGDPLDGHRIVCLFNNRHFFRGGFTPSMLDEALCTHLNYEFAILDPKSYEMIPGEPDLDIKRNFYQEAVDLKKLNSKLKVLVSLGGWADSTEKYSELAADPKKRKNFIEKAIDFLKTHEFDGLDLAWEYPNCWQGAPDVSPKDKPNFVTLLQEMKTTFKENNFLLSVSVGAIKREVEKAYDVPAISGIVDFINVMTYDMHGPWEHKTGHHVQWGPLPGDDDPTLNVKTGMQVWIDMGADKAKLNMGLALYGKTFTLKDPAQCGMGAPVIGVGKPGPDSNEGGFLLYSEICQYVNSGNWTEKEAEGSGFYAYSGDQWVCYDPVAMMVRKVKWMVQNDLGGVLLKDLSGDDYKGKCFSMPFPLLRMIKLSLVQQINKKRRMHG